METTRNMQILWIFQENEDTATKTKHLNKKMKALCCQNKKKFKKRLCSFQFEHFIGMVFHKIIMPKCGMSRKMKGAELDRDGREKWNIGSCRYMKNAWKMLLCRTRVKMIFPFLLTFLQYTRFHVWYQLWIQQKLKKGGPTPSFWYRY